MTTTGIRSPYLYRGSWLWPYDGAYDVHPDWHGQPDDWPEVEGLTLTEAKEWVNEMNWLRRLCGPRGPR